MEVFLIPTGSGGYELYCEVEEIHAVPDERASRGWRRWIGDRFTAIVGSVEAAKHGAAHRRTTRQRRPIIARIRDRVVCWMAERIAEQRLLWHLRGKRQVTAWFPDDIDEPQASRAVRQMLSADADAHTRWMFIDALGLLASLALVPLPGPNPFFYYFVFRVGGHYLSRRGARHGLEHVDWQMRSSPDLTDLRRAFALEPQVRRRRVMEIASRLRLQHLAAFFERIAVAAP